MAAGTGRDDNNSEDHFKNPNCEPLEVLVLTADVHGIKGKRIPALDATWAQKCRPFLKYLNPPDRDKLGRFPLGAKEVWLESASTIEGDLKWLIGLNASRFWSQVIYGKNSLNAMKSFVEQSPPYFFNLGSLVSDDDDINKAWTRIESLVFKVFVKLTTFKISETEWMKQETLGNILYDNFLISVPFLMEACVCFGRDNHRYLSEAVCNVFQYQPKYLEDVKTTVEFLSKVFKHIEEQLSCGRVGGEEPVKLSERPTNQKTLNIQSLSSLVICLLDTIFSITAFADVYKPAATIYRQQHFHQTIADFYENSVGVLNRQIELVCNHEETFNVYCDLKYKMDLARRELLNVVHLMLSSYVNTILQLKQELGETNIKKLADDYIAVVTDCLADRSFMRDYQRGFPIEHDLDVLAQVCPEIDACDFIFESVISCLNDQDVKLKQKPFSVSHYKKNSGHASANYQDQVTNSAKASVKKVTGVELDSLITEVKDLFPHLGDGFVQKCLDHFNYESAAVINAVLEGSLPDPLVGLDREMPYIPPPVEEKKETNGLPERVNIFDNDEFDIMNRDDVNISNMHIGKRRAKHKNLNQLLDDKSHVNQMRDMYTRLSLVESNEDSIYNDEYDDTYDEAQMAVGDEGETERRPFTVPRVLQRRVSLPEEPDEDYLPEETDEKDKPKFEYFVPNPEDVRARYEQQRRDSYRGRGRGGPSSGQRDFVGKPKGQGQDKQVKQNREHKSVYKSRSGNHNRRAMASRKRNQGMVPS